MIRLLLPALALLLSATAFAQPDPNAIGMANNPPTAAVGVMQKLGLDTPEKSARFFFQAVSAQNEYNASIAVSGAPVGYYGSKEWSDIQNTIYPWSYLTGQKIDTVTVNNQTATEATVTITGHREGPHGDPPVLGQLLKYKLPLRLETNVKIAGWGQQDNIWRVVPLSLDEMTAQPLDQLPPLQAVATLYLRDSRLLPRLRLEIAMSQLKQLAIGYLQFIQDYNTTFALDDAARERAVTPYIRNASLFVIPGTDGEKWHFNNNLSGKDFNQIQSPAKTVLSYDGSAPQSDALNFRFDDKTPISFADGHVKFVTRDEAKDLIWIP